MQYLELTLAETGEPILVFVDQIVTIEQRPAISGEGVVISLRSGKDIRVVNSYKYIADELKAIKE